MRIQETDRILKESRDSRRTHSAHAEEHHGNVITRAWHAVTRVFKR
jgi:hypothetical protein